MKSYKAFTGQPLPLPFFEGTLSAGFPSPANDYLEKALDLNELLITNPIATFFIRVEGDSMQEANILSGDILIVDRSLVAESGKIVVALLNGEFTVKRLVKREEHFYLVAENNKYPPIKIPESSDFQVWGVVTYVIHRTR